MSGATAHAAPTAHARRSTPFEANRGPSPNAMAGWEKTDAIDLRPCVPGQPQNYADVSPVRRQNSRLRAEPRDVLGVIADRVANVAHLAAGTGVEAHDAAGFPLGDVRGVAPETHVEPPAGAVLEDRGEGDQIGPGGETQKNLNSRARDDRVGRGILRVQILLRL